MSIFIFILIIFVTFTLFTGTLLTKITAALTKVALSYHRIRGLCFLAVIFARTIV